MNVRTEAAIPDHRSGGLAVESLTLRIGGMTCAHCPPAVEKAIRAVKGVLAASVNLATQTAKGPVAAK